jgi:DNA mismatch repair ATPase MutS
VKVFLMHRDRDFDVGPELRDAIFEAMVRRGDTFGIRAAKRSRERDRDPDAAAAASGHIEALTQDLELETLWSAMAAGDEFLYETAKRGLLSSLTDPGEIVYRQQVLADCLEQPEIVRRMYELAIEAIESTKEGGGLWHGAGASPEMILYRSRNVLELQVDVLKRLRRLADEHAGSFRSDGFTRFFAMLRDELDDGYLRTVDHHLRELQFKRGVLESAELGRGNIGRGYVARTPREGRWSERLVRGRRSRSNSFTVPPRDENGFRTLEEIRGEGINLVANAVAQSADHVKSFFSMLRLELAFYLGCLNLRARLDEKGEPTCFPIPVEPAGRALACEGLYDLCLAFHLDGPVVGNTVDADGKALVMITGANQGGKSTFLRSVGLAQLMLQSGMFVAAGSLRASVCDGLFTHYKREEDASMESGKLDEELSRMSAIADAIRPNSLLLCNESFASTNEREGSEIARQVVRALLEKRIRVVFVTHMFDLAHGFHEQHLETALFLRAERRADGQRTFRLAEGEPLPTSYGADSYRRVFGTAPVARQAASAGGRQ